MTIQKIGICAAATLLCLAPAAFSRTRVVVIGVRDYTGDALTKPVAFAENDATLFGTFSVQRSLDPAPVVLTFPPVAYQLNGVRAQSKAANLPAVENELNALFAQAGPEDIVYVFISSRGIARPGLDGYIGTADMVSEKPESGGMPVRFLRQLIEGSRVGRVIVFADVSRKPGEMLANNINRRVAELGAIPKVAGVLATQPGQMSEEKPMPQPGQGVFGYYLVNSGTAGAMGVSAISNELRRALEQDPAVKGKQKPADFGATPSKSAPVWRASAKSAPVWRAAAGPASQDIRVQISRAPTSLASTALLSGLLAFQAPFQTARVAANVAGIKAQLEQSAPVANPAAMAAQIDALRAQLSGEEWDELQKLGIAKLAGDAQRVVDRYGMQNLLPQDPSRVTSDDFKKAADGFAAALQLVPASGYEAFREELNVRKLLCDALSGPAVAIGSLQQPLKSKAVIPEVHNAAGIYYLESAKDYDQAIREFREAKKASPAWMYPRHNLALALIEKGDYAGAEKEYRDAIATQPLQPYVFYNFGLLLHRMNRRAEAKDAYQRSWDAYRRTIEEMKGRATDWQSRFPEDAALANQRVKVFETNRAEVLNAWGILLASGRDVTGARQKYKDALAIDDNLCPARNNWSQLEQSVVERSDPKAVSKEALALLDRNLMLKACADFSPSLLQRARLRRRNGDVAGARQDFSRVHELVANNTEALEGMAAADEADRRFDSAIAFLTEAASIQSRAGGVYPDIYLQLAEVHRQAKDAAACRDAYDKAIAAVRGSVYGVSTRELRKRQLQCGEPAQDVRR